MNLQLDAVNSLCSLISLLKAGDRNLTAGQPDSLAEPLPHAAHPDSENFLPHPPTLSLTLTEASC